MQLVVESVNNMAKESQTLAWNDLKGVKRRMIADQLMSVVDQVSMTISAFITPDTPQIIMKPNTGIIKPLQTLNFNISGFFSILKFKQNNC